jgi:hypothetical protein
LAVLTTVTSASTSNALPDDGVTGAKHVGAFFNFNFDMNFKFFLRQSTCASVGGKKL